MRYFLLLLLLTLRAFGAAGDVISVTIHPEGWMADIKYSGLSVGGSYNFGLGTNGNPAIGTPKFTLNVVSMSFTDAGAATTIARTVYGTDRVRTPYNTKTVAGSYTTGTFTENEAVTQATTGATGVVVIPGSSGPTLYLHTVGGVPNNSGVWTGATSSATFTPTGVPTLYGASAILPGARTFYDGTNTTIRVSLSDYVYSQDKAGGGNSGTDVTYSILSSLYTAGNAGTGTATNSSIMGYYVPFGNWTIPPFQRFTGAFKLKALALHRHGQSGRPVRMVKFTVTDGTTTVTDEVTDPTVDGGEDDIIPINEYVGNFNASSFIQGADLTCNFIAYPWVGDTEFTTVGGVAAPSATAGPVQHLCDKGSTYGVTYALVDASIGSDSTGDAYDSAVYDANTAQPFLTIGQAARAIRDYNNVNHARDTVGGGVVQLAAGNHTWMNKTVSGGYGAIPKTWLTIEPKTGVAAAAVNITVAALNVNPSDRVRFNNVTLSLTSSNGFSGIDAILYEHCLLNSSATTLVGAGSYQYFDNDQITNWQMSASGITNTPNVMTRSCRFLSPFNRTTRCYMYIGNLFDGTWTHGRVLTGEVNGSGQPLGNPIWAFNKIHGVLPSGPSDVYSAGDAAATTYTGFGIVQNVFEVCDAPATPGLGLITNMFAGESTTTNTPIDHLIYWHNVCPGGRVGFGYNSAGTVLKHRRGWSMKNNYFEATACKTDVFPPQNAIRQGNWPQIWGVGHSGNVQGGNTDVGPAGFDLEFPGVSVIDTGAITSSWAHFVNRLAYAGAGAAPGQGDYHLTALTPFIGLPVDRPLSYDIEGTVWVTDNLAVGPYAFGTPSPPPVSGTAVKGKTLRIQGKTLLLK